MDIPAGAAVFGEDLLRNGSAFRNRRMRLQDAITSRRLGLSGFLDNTWAAFCRAMVLIMDTGFRTAFLKNGSVFGHLESSGGFLQIGNALDIVSAAGLPVTQRG